MDDTYTATDSFNIVQGWVQPVSEIYTAHASSLTPYAPNLASSHKWCVPKTRCCRSSLA